MSTIPELLKHCRELMTKAVESTKRELTGIPGLPPPLVDLPPGCSFNPRCPLRTERCVAEVPALEAVAPGHRAACHYRDRTG